MANFANPTVGSNYTDFPAEIRASVDAALQQLSVGSHTNIPTGAIKFDTSANRWKKFNGSAFVDLTASYDLNAVVSVNELQLESDEKIRLGNSQEFEIFHQSSNNNSIIRENGSGFFSIQTNGSQISFYDIPNNVVMAEFNTGGACVFRHSGSTKLQTNTNGIQITNSLGVGGAASNSLDVFGNVVQFGASNTSDQQLRVGRSGSGNRNAYIDLIGDNTYSTYGLRLIREDGPNEGSRINHRGTGTFKFLNQEAAGFRFMTSSAGKVDITSNGRVGIGTTNPNVELVVRGNTPQITLEPTGDTQSCRYQFATTDGSVQSTIQGGGTLGTGIRFMQSSTEALRINTNNRVGIGISTPDSKLEVRDGSSTGIISRSTATQQTDSNTAFKVRNNSSTDTFSVSYRGFLTVNNTHLTSTSARANRVALFRSGASNADCNIQLSNGVDHSAQMGIVGDNAQFYIARDGVEKMRLNQNALLIGLTSTSGNSISIATSNAVRFQAPSDFWSTGSSFYGVAGYGYFGTHGAFETTLTSGGYRKGSTQWQNYTINGVTGNATQIAMGTQASFIALRLETGKATDSSSAVTDRFRFFPTASLSIASTTEKSKLYINGGESETGGILVENVLYAGNQDKPILIAGTQNWTGATTNWGTYGFQIRMKTDSGGNPRMTVDTNTGELICIRNNQRVGIGTDAPERLLHIVGSDCRIKLSDSDVSPDFELINASGDGLLATNSTQPIRFNTNNSEACRIDATGRFMINRTSADFHLDVAGAARITGYVYLSNAQRVVWGTSNSSFIQGDDNDYILFGVNNEVFRINGSALRIGQTATDFAGAGNTTVGSSITKTGRVHSSTSDHQTGFTANANTSSTSKHFCSFRRNGTQIASIKQETSGVSYNTGSDRRLKENIVDIKNALLTLLKFKPKEYNWKSDKNKVSEHGFIAQDLLEDKLCEYAVSYSEEDDFYGMDYGRLTAITIAAIQELAGKVSDLESKLA